MCVLSGATNVPDSPGLLLDLSCLFNLENSTADMDTIEAIFIDTFLDKHKLTAEWDDAQGSWGSRDLNGMFNGVVGKVIHVYLTILYFFVFRLDIPYVTLEYQ